MRDAELNPKPLTLIITPQVGDAESAIKQQLHGRRGLVVTTVRGQGGMGIWRVRLDLQLSIDAGLEVYIPALHSTQHPAASRYIYRPRGTYTGPPFHTNPADTPRFFPRDLGYVGTSAAIPKP